jgi:transcription initiation factor TFIIIB Brf1 subunit/transcription initiation factor TFIIB
MVVEQVFSEEIEYHYTQDGKDIGFHGTESSGTFMDDGSKISKRLQASLMSKEDLDNRDMKDVLTQICLALKISLPNIIFDTALEISRLHREKVRLSGRKKNATYAAAMYFSCKINNSEREIRLFSTTCCIDIKLLNFGIKSIKENLNDSQYMKVTKEENKHSALLSQFVTRLDISSDEAKKLRRDSLNMMDSIPDVFDSGKKPRTILSAIIFINVFKLGIDIDKKEMSTALNVCSQSVDGCMNFIRKTYKIDF